MPNILCFDTVSDALVVMDSTSKARNTTHHDLPPYSVWIDLVLTAETSKGCTNAPCQSLNNYRQITFTHVKIWIWLTSSGLGMPPRQAHYVTELRTQFIHLHAVGRRVLMRPKCRKQHKRAGGIIG